MTEMTAVVVVRSWTSLYMTAAHHQKVHSPHMSLDSTRGTTPPDSLAPQYRL